MQNNVSPFHIFVYIGLYAVFQQISHIFLVELLNLVLFDVDPEECQAELC